MLALISKLKPDMNPEKLRIVVLCKRQIWGTYSEQRFRKSDLELHRVRSWLLYKNKKTRRAKEGQNPPLKETQTLFKQPTAALAQ
jgi:hypothetical protein